MNPQNAKTSATSSYFTEEFMAKVREMSASEMVDMLKDLESTRYWIALVKYSHERMNVAQQGLYTLDPFKEQTAMARYQGILTGLTDVQEAIIRMKQEADKTEKETYNDQTGKSEPEPMGY